MTREEVLFIMEKVMTYEEALFIIEEVMDDYRPTGDCEFAFWKALTSLQKQIPKKPIYTNKGSVTKCPNCGAIHLKVLPSLEFDYCTRCGQAIDWSEE